MPKNRISLVLKSRLIYFILIVSLVLVYKTQVKRKILNNYIVPLTHESSSSTLEKNDTTPCNIYTNTIKYYKLPSANAEETEDSSSNRYLSSTGFLEVESINSLENDKNLLKINHTIRASGNSDGIAYTIEEFNHLNVHELKKFYGIGDVTAAAIIKLRNQRGGFKSFQELLDVKGIGPAKFKKIMGGEYEEETD